jgi:hypothetical protein
LAHVLNICCFTTVVNGKDSFFPVSHPTRVTHREKKAIPLGNSFLPVYMGGLFFNP